MSKYFHAANTSMRRRTSWIIAFTILTAHAALVWVARSPGLISGQDGATYVLLGRAIRDFHYRELFQVGQPPHRMYPPGYPSMLAIWSSIGGEGFDWLVIPSIVSSVGALALLFSTIRRLWGPQYALAGLLALALNPWVVESAGRVASESPFMFFQVLVLWALSRDSEGPAMTVLAGGAAIAAAMVRSIGVTLILSVGLFWLWRRRFRAIAIYIVAVVLTVGLWLGWTAQEVAPVGGSYVSDAAAGVSEFGLVSAVITRLTNKWVYPFNLYQLLPGLNVPRNPVDDVIGVIILAPILLAAVPVLFTTWRAAFLYLAVYGALLWMWAWPVPRFLIPLLLLFVPLVILGSARLVAWVRPNRERTAIVVVTTLLAVNGARMVADVIERQKDCVPGAALPSRGCLDEDRASFVSAIEYIRQSVSSDAIFLTGKREDLYYYTGRRAVSQTRALSQSPSDFLPYLRREGVTHVLLLTYMPVPDGVPSAAHLTLGEMLKANCQNLHLEASFPPASFLFRVPSEDESPDQLAACRAVDVYLERNRAAIDERQWIRRTMARPPGTE